MGMDTLRRHLAAIKADLDALSAPPAVCADAVTLWRRIYGDDPDPWQHELMVHERPRLLINGSRQSGKSSVSAMLGLYEALYRPPALVLLVSASLRQAQELGKKVFDGYRALGKPGGAEAENKLSLELANGSRIVCLPATESTIRGMSGARLIVLDEASRVPDPLYHAVRPMLAVSGGRLMGISTPWGKRGWWFEAWEQGTEWHRVKVTAPECPRISAAFLEEERRSLPPWVFDQEYMCVFGETLDAVFRYEDIANMLSDDVAPLFTRGEDHAHPFLISDLLSRS
jgi:Terminase large subunit, T4likevirus-type, N-terminal